MNDDVALIPQRQLSPTGTKVPMLANAARLVWEIPSDDGGRGGLGNREGTVQFCMNRGLKLG